HPVVWCVARGVQGRHDPAAELLHSGERMRFPTTIGDENRRAAINLGAVVVEPPLFDAPGLSELVTEFRQRRPAASHAGPWADSNRKWSVEGGLIAVVA